MSKPLVTVVIPTYNRLDLLPKAINSVLGQTYDNIEILVVDDGQDEPADQVVAKYNSQKVRYIKHEEQKGCSGAKNTGIQNAHGAYIAFLDDDDEFLPNKVEEQVSAMENAPESVGFSFTGAYEVYDDREYEKKAPNGVADYHELSLRNFSAMIDSSMVYKKEVFEKVGLLNEEYPTHTGAEFIIRVTQYFQGVGINKPLVRRLMVSEHMQMGRNIHNRIKGRIMLLELYKEDFAKYPAFLAKHLTFLAKLQRAVGSYKEAGKSFMKACILEPRLGRFFHWTSMLGGGFGYRIFKKIKG